MQRFKKAKNRGVSTGKMNDSISQNDLVFSHSGLGVAATESLIVFTPPSKDSSATSAAPTEDNPMANDISDFFAAVIAGTSDCSCCCYCCYRCRRYDGARSLTLVFFVYDSVLTLVKSAVSFPKSR